MSGLFPASLIKRQVLILVDSLDPARGGGDKCARQTNLRLATAANTAIPGGLNLLIKLHFLLLTLVRFSGNPPRLMHKIIRPNQLIDAMNSSHTSNSLQVQSHSRGGIAFLLAAIWGGRESHVLLTVGQSSSMCNGAPSSSKGSWFMVSLLLMFPYGLLCTKHTLNSFFLTLNDDNRILKRLQGEIKNNKDTQRLNFQGIISSTMKTILKPPKINRASVLVLQF